MSPLRWLVVVGVLATPAGAFAQSTGSVSGFPERALRLMVAFPPGGPNDLIARLMAPRVAEVLKQPVVVENRGGSNGEIAAAAVAKSAPDGYSLLFVSNGALVISPALGKQLPFDPQRDLAPITALADSPMMLVTNADLPVRNVAELIALARAQRGKLNVASAGNGSATHLAAELFKSMAQVDAAHVPYKGGGPAYVDLLVGQVQFYFGGLTTALPYVKAGRARGLAVTSRARSAAAPEVPTIAETLPGYEASIWYAVMTTGGTPRAIVRRLHEVITGVMRSPDIRGKLVELGADPMEFTPEQFADFIRADTEKWTKVVRAAGIKPE